MDILDLLAREGMIARHSVGPLRARSGPAIAAAIDAGLVADDVVADLVARETGTVVIDLDRGTLENEAVRLLPEDIARKHLAIVMALEPGGRAVRAAFANPLDARALSDVAEATSRSVRALVGTVTGIRGAIDREYGNPPTRELAVIEDSAELSPESTRRVPSARARGFETPSEEIPGTLPVHRLEQEATMEQRHEALLLALIERGVITRADYGDALKRLLGKR